MSHELLLTPRHPTPHSPGHPGPHPTQSAHIQARGVGAGLGEDGRTHAECCRVQAHHRARRYVLCCSGCVVKEAVRVRCVCWLERLPDAPTGYRSGCRTARKPEPRLTLPATCLALDHPCAQPLFSTTSRCGARSWSRSWRGCWCWRWSARRAWPLGPDVVSGGGGLCSRSWSAWSGRRRRRSRCRHSGAGHCTRSGRGHLHGDTTAASAGRECRGRRRCVCCRRARSICNLSHRLSIAASEPEPQEWRVAIVDAGIVVDGMDCTVAVRVHGKRVGKGTTEHNVVVSVEQAKVSDDNEVACLPPRASKPRVRTLVTSVR